MSTKIDGRRTEEYREAARLRGYAQFASPEARAAHGELTRQAMQAPGVRERIVAGMKGARKHALQLDALQESWRRASESVRLQFLAEITRSGREGERHESIS